MKRFLFLLVAIQIALVSFGQKPVIVMKVISTDEAVMEELERAGAIPQIEFLFQKKLFNTYNIRLVDADSEHAFALLRNTEFVQQESKDFDSDTKKSSHLKGASYLCLVEISKINNGKEYHWRVKLGDTETASLLNLAEYPGINDRPTESLDRESLQRACLKLIKELGLDEEKTQKEINDYHQGQRRRDRKAVTLSLCPGMGLIAKGYKGLGWSLMAGDLVLLGGGIGMLGYAVPRIRDSNKIDSNRTMPSDQYIKIKSRCIRMKKAGISCMAGFGAVYLTNLLLSRRLPNKNPDFYVYIEPSMSPVDSNMSLNLSLTYKF